MLEKSRAGALQKDLETNRVKPPRSPVLVASFDQNILLFDCFFCRAVSHPFFGCIRGYIISE
jgi:hypothetical protein